MNNIGEKIKKARQSRNLTQAELCGSKITRNLLSLIERGKATPSVKTLSYIADRLDMPVGYFFARDEKEEAIYKKYSSIDKIKKYYKSKQYDKCISLCSETEKEYRDDEINLMLAKSCFYNALSLADSYDIGGAKNLLKLAGDTAKYTVYLGVDFYRAIDYYIMLMSSLDSVEMSAELYDLNHISSYVPADLIKYIESLNLKSSYNFTGFYHKIHIAARDKMKNGDFSKALNLLNDMVHKGNIPFYMRFFVYDDIETCSNQINDYYSAYNAAKIKLSLIELLKKQNSYL